ncbi:MAG: hypothetical protein RQ731_03375 [Anaerosomatales bacterium]|nr:hypothetical protein [Anaerosomatales bacterium]MDT8433783.1 hypothetical protein [Anaerosomatales bacterium]
MIAVKLSEEEASLLKKSLELLLSDVRMEICDTDSGDFRAGLKREKAVLEHVIEQLEAGK